MSEPLNKPVGVLYLRSKDRCAIRLMISQMKSFQCRLTLAQSGRVKHYRARRNYNDFICAAKIDALFEL